MPFEKFEMKKPEIPAGKGREVSEELYDWLLLFEKVKNKVAFVNKEVYTPLKLEKGKESPLGLFAKSAIPELFQRKPGEQQKMREKRWLTEQALKSFSRWLKFGVLELKLE